MIVGIGTDLVLVDRMADLWQRHGDRALEKILAPVERDACRNHTDTARFLAKRFAAKEALGKALGTGIRAPVLLPAIEVIHDELGKPGFAFHGELAEFLREKAFVCHLSISDEKDHAIAFVIVESA